MSDRPDTGQDLIASGQAPPGRDVGGANGTTVRAGRVESDVRADLYVVLMDLPYHIGMLEVRQSRPGTGCVGQPLSLELSGRRAIKNDYVAPRQARL